MTRPEVGGPTSSVGSVGVEIRLIHDLGNSLNAINLQLWLAGQRLLPSPERSHVEMAAREIRVATDQLAILGQQLEDSRRRRRSRPVPSKNEMARKKPGEQDR